MSLKDKINETKTIKPKIEAELTKINSVVTGGTNSNTLVEVSTNITNMIKTNYKKFAKGTYSYNMNNSYYVDIYKNPIVVKYSLDFTPKYIFCHIPGGYTSSVYDTNLYDPIFSSCYIQRTAHPKNGYISNITKTSFKIISSGQSDANEVSNQNSDSHSLTINWIAIG